MVVHQFAAGQIAEVARIAAAVRGGQDHALYGADGIGVREFDIAVRSVKDTPEVRIGGSEDDPSGPAGID